ncbi:MAG: hypothetical protein GC171_16730 [Terrimonas sp.]|nr:hypothetical protein [Terrimonas sp.]
MKILTNISLTALLILSFRMTDAQYKPGKIIFDQTLKDTFSYVHHWDYPWYILKDEETGELSNALNTGIHQEDTAHLYFTAHCETNVQGGYLIRYCEARRFGDTLKLILTDGLPAYASIFHIDIIKDSFNFSPELIFPAYSTTQPLQFSVQQQAMTLNLAAVDGAAMIFGFINFQFEQVIPLDNKPPEIYKYYLRGSIRTPIVTEQQ